MSLRFGVVGTAFWARDVHLPGLLRAKDAEVVGIWGRTAAPAQAIAAEHGIRAFPRFADLLDAVDAVAMAVPPEAQAELGLAAAKAGKHLILEKPVAMRPEAADAIADALAARRRAGLVFFTRRFVPEITAAIAAERDHPWTRATVRAQGAAFAPDSPYAQSVWRQAPGAALWDIGPHVLSMLLPMLGPVEHAAAEPEHDGVTRLATRHRGGARADISVSLRAKPEDAGNSYEFQSAKRRFRLPEPPGHRREAFTRAAEALTAMAEAGVTEHACDVRFGATVTRILADADAGARAQP